MAREFLTNDTCIIANDSVDVIVSSVTHDMEALCDVLKKKKVKEKLKSCSFMEGLDYKHLYSLVKQTSFNQMIEALCCAKEEQPDLHFNEIDPCPTMVPLKCTLGMNGSPCVN